MTRERRNGKPAIPRKSELFGLLNEDQKISLKTLEKFSWELFCVRRPLFQEPVFIMHNLRIDKYALLDFRGLLDHESSLVLR